MIKRYRDLFCFLYQRSGSGELAALREAVGQPGTRPRGMKARPANSPGKVLVSEHRDVFGLAPWPGETPPDQSVIYRAGVYVIQWLAGRKV